MKPRLDCDVVYDTAQIKNCRRAAVIIVVRLVPAAEAKTCDDIKREIQRVLEEDFADIPGLVLEALTVVSG